METSDLSLLDLRYRTALFVARELMRLVPPLKERYEEFYAQPCIGHTDRREDSQVLGALFQR